MVKGSVKVVLSLSLVFLVTPYAMGETIANSVLPEGARIVAGDPQQNEFYILAKGEQLPANARRAPAIIQAHHQAPLVMQVANTPHQQPHAIVPTTTPNKQLASNTKQVPLKTHALIPTVTPTKQLAANIKQTPRTTHSLPVVSHKIMTAFHTVPDAKKKHLLVQSQPKVVAFKPVIKTLEEVYNTESKQKVKLQANAAPSMKKSKRPVNAEQSIADSRPMMLTTLEDVKRFEARLAKHVVPKEAPIKHVAVKTEKNSKYKEVAQYITYNGETRKVISYVSAPSVTPKALPQKPKQHIIAMRSKPVPPTFDLND